MKAFIAVFALLFFVAVQAADDQRMRLVQLKQAQLVLMKLVRKDDLFAKFSGQVWVSGTVIGRWPEGATNMDYKEPEYILVPDEASRVGLPYFVLRDPPYFNRYMVRTITLLNGREALRKAVGERQAQRLYEKRVNHVRATGRFLIDQYIVGVECDAPWATGNLVDVESPERVASEYLQVPEGC